MYAVCYPFKNTQGPDWLHKTGEAWITKGDFGLTAETCKSDTLPLDLKTWDSKETIREVLLDWEGHPYWYARDRMRPYRIVQVEPVYESVLAGYKPAKEEEEQDATNSGTTE